MLYKVELPQTTFFFLFGITNSEMKHKLNLEQTEVTKKKHHWNFPQK